MNKIKVNKDTELIFIGDIHEHEEQFDKLVEHIQPSSSKLLISLGDILDKGYGKKVGYSITSKMMKLHDQGFGYVIKGNHELKNIKTAKNENTMNEYLEWLRKCPLSLTFQFPNGTMVTAVHAGVLPKHKEEDLSTDVSVAYVREIDAKGKSISLKKVIENNKVKFVPTKENGIVWHEVYDGRFGYIVSGHASQKDGKPKFYNYSCNLDSCCYNSGILSALVMNQNGKKELLSFTGTPKYPDYDELLTLMVKGNV
jgi:predicted phosphodiesterase